MFVVVDVHEDGEAGDGNADVEHGEEEAMAEAVGQEGGEHAPAEGGGPGRDGMELGLDGAVAVAFDDGGSKVGVSVGWILSVSCLLS